ncbi:MAG: chloride channel protein [Pseudomonadota bacterium]
MILGVLSGAASGALLISFRAMVEWILSSTVTPTHPEAFETLAWPVRLLLPIGGALLVVLLFARLGSAHVQVGVVHVMERLAYHQGAMPWRNALAQYVGAVIALCSGHSMGREGPGVHLGAAAGSWVGQGLGVPNNSMRVLIACGTAGSIAASFNTPIAGVIFAMEVVMMEYTIVGFAPVIVSAAVAAWMSQAVYGDAAAFAVPALELNSLLELPLIVGCGCAIGLLAALFVRSTATLQRAAVAWPLWRRGVLAGVMMGAAAVVAPEVMGIGYDTVEATLHNRFAISALLLILVTKLVASTICAGLGMPGGVIAPMLFMGASAGAALGLLGQAVAPDLSASPAFYAMLGMGAMMAACLHAPLAGLMAIVELTQNVKLILPGMVCIVSAVLIARSLLRTEPMFIASLKVRGADYVTDPVALALSRSGITSRMNASFKRVTHLPETDEDWAVLNKPSVRWLVHEAGQETRLYLVSPAADGAAPRSAAWQAECLVSAEVSVRATVQEGRERLSAQGAEGLIVRRLDGRVCGVVTAEMLGATSAPKAV